MNKIHKVVWSKVKSCYVVVSEIAQNIVCRSVKTLNVDATIILKGLMVGSLMTFVTTGSVLANSNDSVLVKDGYTITVSDSALKVIYDGANDTIVDKKGFIFESNKKINNLL